MKRLILFLMLFSTNLVYSQGEGYYTTKYWNYRYALRGDDIDPSYPNNEPGFLKVGGGPGFSIPMRKRLRREHQNNNPINNYYWGLNLPDNRNPNSQYNTIGIRDGILSWVDAPTDLGKYLVVLATELELLMQDAQNYNVNTLAALEAQNYNLSKALQMTYHELSMAVNVMDRLDRRSNILYGGSEQNGDGFFIRDDVPIDFADDGKFGKAQFLSQGNYWTNSNISNKYYKGNCFLNIGSQYTEKEFSTTSTVDGLPMSKDQMIKVFLGVIYAKQFMSNFKNKFGDPNDLQHRCFDILDRTLWYIFPDYSIVNPSTGNPVYYGSGAITYSGPLYSIYNRYASGDFCSLAYSYSTVVGEPFWAGQKIFYTTTFPICLINSSMFPGAGHSHEMFTYLAIMDNRSTMFTPNSLYYFGYILGSYSDNELEYQFNFLAEALRQRLHGGGFSFALGTSTVPSINFRWMPLSQYENFMNRWNFECYHETRMYDANPSTFEWEEKNGLDYMMAHNLYLLEKGNSLKIDMASNKLVKFVNLYDRVVEGTFPRSNGTIMPVTNPTFPPTVTNQYVSFTYGTPQYPADIQAANSIDARNCEFLPNSKASLRAPHIILSPGFIANYGSVCDVRENSRMECKDYSYINSGIKGVSIVGKSTINNQMQNIDPSISLYPNPTTSVSKINVKGFKNTDVLVLVYDLMGREIFRQNENDIETDDYDISLKTSGFQVGTYIVKVKNKDVEKVARMIVLKN